MQKAISTAIGGLLWLALSTAGFATTLTITSYNYSADSDGGGFQAYLNSNSTDLFEVYCVDYLNDADQSGAYTINIDTPNLSAPDDGLGDTRYGTTTTFSWNSIVAGALSSSGDEFGDAYDRYVMAGWLTTQYDSFAQNSTDADGIQSAIWTLLDVNGANFSSDGDTLYWLQQAINFMNSPGFNSFASDVEVYTDTTISGDTNLNYGTADNRYQTGYQEFISVIPEPADLVLVGCGLLFIGALRRGRRPKI